MDVAAQIPYCHPSMKRLAILVLEVMESQEDFFAATKFVDEGAEYKSTPYNEFVGAVRETMGSYGGHGYVNYHAFVAHVYAMVWQREPNPFLAGWELRRAFEEEPSESKSPGSIIMAAAQWIILYGDSIFKYMKNSRLIVSVPSPGSKFQGSNTRSGLSELVSWIWNRESRMLSRARWDYWRESSSNIAFEDKALGFSKECRLMCCDAAEKMEEVEKAYLGSIGVPEKQQSSGRWGDFLVSRQCRALWLGTVETMKGLVRRGSQSEKREFDRLDGC